MRRRSRIWSYCQIGLALLMVESNVVATEDVANYFTSLSVSKSAPACGPESLSLIGKYNRNRILAELEVDGWHLPSAEQLRTIYSSHEHQFGDGLFWVAPPSERSQGFNWYYSVPRKQVMEFGDILSFPAFLLLVNRDERPNGHAYACIRN